MNPKTNPLTNSRTVTQSDANEQGIPERIKALRGQCNAMIRTAKSVLSELDKLESVLLKPIESIEQLAQQPGKDN